MALLFAFFIVMAVLKTIRSVFSTRASEQSRREIAAYVAEGSISTEEAARLLDAGKKERKSWCCSEG